MSSERPQEPTRVSTDSTRPASTDAEIEEFKLRVSKDRMKIYLECDTEGKDIAALAGAIANRLAVFGARKPPDKDELQQWLGERARTSPQLVDVPVLEGKPPRPPVDGRIAWGGDFFNPGFITDEATGRVNFRKRAGQRNVKAGQLLATILQPVPGENGMDALGAILRTRKPRSVRIRAGDHVRADDTIAAYYATTDGRIRWHNDTLSVDQLYEVTGDVGLETGDISHQGAVLVHGDVLKGARLEAVGDIEVFGVIDGAQVQTGGMLNVHGGITGSPGIRVVAGGGVHAKYMLDADVQSGGDIVVEAEIMHSSVTTRGALLAPLSRVIGGRVVALGGIDIAQAGSQASVPTILVAGEDHSLEGKCQILHHKLKLARENIDKINGKIAPLRGKIESLPEKSKSAVRALLQQLPKLEASVVDLQRQIDDARMASELLAFPTVLIRERIFPEVRLHIKGATTLVREEDRGPLRWDDIDGNTRLTRGNLRTLAKPSGHGHAG